MKRLKKKANENGSIEVINGNGQLTETVKFMYQTMNHDTNGYDKYIQILINPWK